MLRKILWGIGIGLLIIVVGAVLFVYVEASAFDASIAKVYSVESPSITASNDPQIIARGQHLAESLGGCIGCHGADLGGAPAKSMGPLGSIYPANLTRGQGGIGAQYSDAQLARLIRHGIKADGRSLRFMPAQDLSWWPDDDLVAIVSYVRSRPPVDRMAQPSSVGMIGKVLDRLDMVPLDIARRIDHSVNHMKTLTPAATREYGAYLARSCASCHGPNLSGGKIPGAPPDLPIPANITPDVTGIKHYAEADFLRLLATGTKPNGKPLDPFMPIASLRAMNDVEQRALWAYLSSLPPRPFGGR